MIVVADTSVILNLSRILLESRQRGLIPEVKAVLDRLETEAGFWVSPQLRRHVLRVAGE